MKPNEWSADQSLLARTSGTVPAFLRQYAKAADRREEHDAQFGIQLDGTVQGKSWASRGGDNLPVIHVPCSPARNTVQDSVYSRVKVCDAPSERLEFLNGTERCVGTNAAAEARVGRFGSGVILESVESQPLMNMFCAGQRLDGHSAQRCVSPKKGIGANATDSRDPSARRQISVDNTAPSGPTQTLALNKLYSSLKKMKSRRGEACMEDLAAVSSGRHSSFSRSFLNKILGGQDSASSRRDEEVFILLGGKSRPVRLQFKTDGLHLVRENEWGVDLKSREGLLCEMDRDCLALLEKFRERYRLVGRSPQALDKKLIRNTQFPWARHVVYKGDLYEEKGELMENDSGSKLSIHVYLPNAGWDVQEQGAVES